MGMGLGMNRGLFLGSTSLSSGGGGPVVPVPGAAPFYDTFGGTAILNGRSGWTVESTTAAAGFITNVFATSGGQLTRSTSSTGVHCYHDTGAGSGESWGVWKGGTVGFASDSAQSHTTVDPTNNNTSMVFCGSSGNQITDRYVLNGTNTGSITASVKIIIDDVIEHSTKDIAGTKYLQGYHNGYFMTIAGVPSTGRDIATLLGRPPNGRYGIKGNTNTPAARMFTGGNKATDAFIRVLSPGRVRQRGVNWRIYFEYASPNGATPADAGSTVKIYMKDTTSGGSDTPIAGYDGLALSNVVCAAGKGVGTIPNPNVDNVWFELRWEYTDGGGNAAFVAYPSSNQLIGDVILGEGQSEAGFLDSNISTGAVVAAPATGFKMSSTATNVLSQNIPTPVSADNAISLMINTIQGYNGGKPVQHLLSYYGGEGYKHRGPNPGTGGTTQFQNTINLLQYWAYGQPRLVYMTGGNTDKSTRTVYQDMIDTADAMDAAAGVALTYGVCPLGSIVSANDTDVEVTRREQWRLTRDALPPGRFKLIAWRNDMQHNSSGGSVDPDHYANAGSVGYVFGTTVGVGEHARRIGLGYCLLTGLTTDDCRGPRPIAFRRVNSTTMAWKYAKDSFTSVDLVNSAFAGLHTGGHRFCAASDFVTLIYPDGHSVQADPGDNTQEIFFTRSGGWPALVYSSGIYGADPLNPGGIRTDAVALDIQGKASAVVGLKTGMASVLMQPTYDIGGTNIDYLSA